MCLSAPCAAARCSRRATRSPITPSAHCVRLTSLPSFHRRRKHCRRWQSTDAAATNPKISGIVDQISQLTLLETADLVASLKVRDSRPPNFLPQAFSPLSLSPSTLKAYVDVHGGPADTSHDVINSPASISLIFRLPHRRQPHPLQ